MTMTSTTITIPKGIDVNIYNNGILYSTTEYINNKISSTTKYDVTGTKVTELDTFLYNTNGSQASEHMVSGTGSILGDVYFNYTNGSLSTMTHYNGLGILTETDYIINGRVTKIVMATVPVVTPPPTIAIITTPTSAPTPPPVTVTTPVWNNVYGHGEIDMIKALSIVGTSITNVTTTQQWGLQSAHFDDSTSAGYIGKGIVIADIDTGIDLNNKALTGNLSKYNWNFITNTANVQDDNGHGSFTASEMIATNTGNGVIGAAYGSQLIVLKAMDAKGSGTAANVALAIDYAVDHGANIINMSLNSPIAMPALDAALLYASKHNVLVAISSGNIMGVGPEAPANDALTLPNVVSVGGSMNVATGLNYNPSSNSAGSKTAFNYVVAPSVNIQGYNNVGTIITDQGTSMAAAYTSAAMAVIESAYIQTHPSANASTINLAVMDALIHGTDSIGLLGVSKAMLAA